MVKTEEIQIEPQPEKDGQPKVKEEENLPQEIIIDEGIIFSYRKYYQW